MIKIVLFEPYSIIDRLSPISATRALFEIRIGIYSLRELISKMAQTLLPDCTVTIEPLNPIRSEVAATGLMLSYDLIKLRLHSDLFSSTLLKSSYLDPHYNTQTNNIQTAKSTLQPSKTILYLNAALVPNVTFIEKLLKTLYLIDKTSLQRKISNTLWLEQNTAIKFAAEPVLSAKSDSFAAAHALNAEKIIGWLTSEEVAHQTDLLEKIKHAITRKQPNPKTTYQFSATKLIGTELHEILDSHEVLLASQIAYKVKTATKIEEIAPNVFIHQAEPVTSFQITKNHTTDLKNNLAKCTFHATAQKPILLEHSTTISAYNVLTGPLYIGMYSRTAPNSILANSSLGHHTRIGGEVTSSIFHDFSNKSHFGFIGHSIIGSWVNLGAGTTTSNLKNTYEHIVLQRLTGGTVQTGRVFVGAFIGDHVKTAILTGIYGGRSIGVAASTVTTVTHNVPHFTFLTHSTLHPNNYPHTTTTKIPPNNAKNYARNNAKKMLSLAKILATQKAMGERRNLTPTTAAINLLKTLYNLQKSSHSR
ncbi:hypothetical protein COTS27_00197 [Spirochaetota bacterium]|nr:hypothetical protein COTS27_00197 [Spirochaetota bacterium]